MNDRSLAMLKRLPCWRDERGDIVPPGAVLSVAAKLLEALAENLQTEEHSRARAACTEAAAFVKMIAETSSEKKMPEGPCA